MEGYCSPLYCDLQQQLGSLVRRIPESNGQNPTVTINSTAVLSCSVPGYVFNIEGGNIGSKIMVRIGWNIDFLSCLPNVTAIIKLRL